MFTDLYKRWTVASFQYPLINYFDSVEEENREIVYCVDKRGSLFIPKKQTKQDTTDIDEYVQELKVRNYWKDI